MLNRELLLASGGNPLQMGVGPVYDYHGFKLQRHSSQEATIISYKAADGTMQRIAVKDAKFRSVQKFGTLNIDVPELKNYPNLVGENFFIVGNSRIDPNKEMPDSVTNDAIFTRCSEKYKNDKTAKENCDIWMTYNNYTDSLKNKGVPAVAWCRSQKLLGQPCDLPNAYELICIWACADKLDEIDPTSNSYPTLRLGYTSTASKSYGRIQSYDGNISSDGQFSSTESNLDYEIGMSKYGTCSGGHGKNTYEGVVPILELKP